MKLRFIGVLTVALLAWGVALADPPSGFGEFPTPKGLELCAEDDPVAALEARAAPKLGGELLGCFRSEQTTMVRGVPVPAEYAFAIAVQGDGYTSADLDALRLRVTQQWKGFNPLSKEFKETYIARLNQIIQSTEPNSSVTMSSVSPVLVSIDRLNSESYSVTSIRSYTLEVSGEPVSLAKVNSDAVALRRSKIIRLTIQRTLSDPSDVAEAQAEIADWARATIGRPSIAGGNAR